MRASIFTDIYVYTCIYIYVYRNKIFSIKDYVIQNKNIKAHTAYTFLVHWRITDKHMLDHKWSVGRELDTAGLNKKTA